MTELIAHLYSHITGVFIHAEVQGGEGENVYKAVAEHAVHANVGERMKCTHWLSIRWNRS